MLLFQLQFLPYHSLFATWAQRVALAFDLFLIWWLCGGILSSRELNSKNNWVSLLLRSVMPVLCIGALAFSVLIVTFPGERQESYSPRWPTLPNFAERGNSNFFLARPERLSLHDWLFREEPDPATRQRFPFSNTLVLTGLNIYEGLGIDDPEKIRGRHFVFRARGRHLEGAIFDFADLAKVDFAGAKLQGATFDGAELAGASFACPVRPVDILAPGMQSPDSCTQLQRAAFAYANLQGATFDGAQLQGASLYAAQLQVASLSGAALEGANLDRANLQATTLAKANLAGASMEQAQLQGASLEFGDLQGANLNSADLEGASLDYADLRVALLDSAQLQGASLQRTRLNAADLSGAYLWRMKYTVAAGEKPTIKLTSPNFLPLSGDAIYAIRTAIAAFPRSELRDAALERLRRLDCANPASCDGAQILPPMAAELQGPLESELADDATYAKAAAMELKDLVCAKNWESTPYVLDGLLRPRHSARNLDDLFLHANRLEAAGRRSAGTSRLNHEQGLPCLGQANGHRPADAGDRESEDAGTLERVIWR